MPWGHICPQPVGHKFYLGLYRENFRNLPVSSHEAQGYQILHATSSSGPSVRGLNYSPKVELIAKDKKFNMGLFRNIFRNLFVRTTNFSPSSESYVLNKYPSIGQWSDTGPSWPSCFRNVMA